MMTTLRPGGWGRSQAVSTSASATCRANWETRCTYDCCVCGDRFRTCMSSSMRWRSGVMAISCERAWSSPGMYTEHMWGIQSIRTAGKPRSLNLDGMLALPLPRSGLVQNHLGGAPRIHGELVKLGIAVSERTVSRYLQGRPTTRSQTWRTFFANHLADMAFMSPLMSSSAPGDDDVEDASGLSFCPVQRSLDGLCAATQSAVVDWAGSRRPTLHGWRLAQDHVYDRTGARNRTGRDPPRHLRLQLA
jgi:hypothetical protein